MARNVTVEAIRAGPTSAVARTVTFSSERPCASEASSCFRRVMFSSTMIELSRITPKATTNPPSEKKEVQETPPAA